MQLVAATNENDWDAFVIENGGGFLQSWGWATFQEALGRRVWRYAMETPSAADASVLETTAQFSLVDHPLRFGFRYLYVPWGPVLGRGTFNTDAMTVSQERLETVTVALRKAARRDGAVFVRSDFPYLREGGLVSAGSLASLGFEQVNAVQPADSVVIDLLRSEEELLAGMHQKTRYNIKVAERHGVTIRETDGTDPKALAEDMARFWAMLGETSERDRFHTHPERYYRTMLSMLSSKEGRGCRVFLRFAERDGKALAAGLFAAFGSRVTYLHGASLSSERKYMAPFALHWQVIREAKAMGMARYDLWGVAPDDSPDHDWAGITRFKQGFGGNRVGYLGTWELPNQTFWYTLYRWAREFLR